MCNFLMPLGRNGSEFCRAESLYSFGTLFKKKGKQKQNSNKILDIIWILTTNIKIEYYKLKS